MPELNCIVVTPEQTVCEKPADFVVATLFDGEIGIAPGHSPLIGRLGYGELRIRRGEETDRFYIEGGFVEVMQQRRFALDAPRHSRRQARRGSRPAAA